MKKLLTATTALALVGGAAFAEITISGDAKLGLNYDSKLGDMMSKHSFTHEMGVDFSGSGTTDGGLSFGAKAGFDTKDTETNTGSVFISGAFGKVTIGDNDSADLLAGGIADVGLDGRGVDDVAEDLRGTTKSQFRYDHTVGNISLAISAGTDKGMKGFALGNADRASSAENPIEVKRAVGGNDGKGFEVKKNQYAIGMSFSASGATVGLGYDSNQAISVGFGYSTGQIAANAFYAKRGLDYYHAGSDFAPGGDSGDRADKMESAGMTGLGLDVSYTIGASTLTLVYAKTDVDKIQPIGTAADGTPGTDVVAYGSTSFKGMGLGVSHDLGGGAKLVAGFAKVPMKPVADLNLTDIGLVPDADTNPSITAADRKKLNDSKNVASVGLSFSF